MANNVTEVPNNYIRIVTSDCNRVLTHTSTVCTTAYWIETVRPYLLIVLGIIGNSLNIFTLLRKRLRKLSTSVFLIFLAASDLLSAITTPWTTRYQNLSVFHCKVLWFIVNVPGLYSSWILVMVSIERMIFVKYPIFARARITWRIALISCLVALAGSVLVNVHYLIGNDLITHSLPYFTNSTQIVSKICFYSSASYQQFRVHVWPTLFMLTFVGLPIGTMIITSVMIISGLRKKGRQLASVSQNANRDSSRDRRDAALSRMMTFVILYFIISTLPYCIYQISINLVPPLPIGSQFHAHVLLHTLLIVLVTSNYAFNCVFYFCFGTQLRREWKEIIDGMRRKMRTTFGEGNVVRDIGKATSTTSRSETNHHSADQKTDVPHSSIKSITHIGQEKRPENKRASIKPVA